MMLGKVVVATHHYINTSMQVILSDLIISQALNNSIFPCLSELNILSILIINTYFFFQPQQQGQSNDCETLDLSMPRRRESAATPPTFQRDMPLPSHRKSPSFASMSSAAAACKISKCFFCKFREIDLCF